MEQKGKWGSRMNFILAVVGAAVGLGNAWRFPGLMALHGGAAFLFAYVLGMLIFGIPILMAEIAIGKKARGGAIRSFATINKKTKNVGWAMTFNIMFIASYYAIVFAWVILMMVNSYRFAGLTGNTEGAKELFTNLISVTQTTNGWDVWSPRVIVFAIIAWVLIYLCIRDGANSVNKVTKFTVFGPIIIMVILAIKGIAMPNSGAALAKLFVPDINAFYDITLWTDAIGQVFNSMSIGCAVLFTYGSYLEKDSNIAVDSVIVALSDTFCSILASVVMYTTMGSVGMLDDMTSSGISTAFEVYPQAIVMFSNNGIVNAIFGFLFYACLVTLAIDSAFALVEGISDSFSSYYGWNHKKVTAVVIMILAVFSLVYVNGAGFAILDIVDHYTNDVNLIIIGILECIVFAWVFDSEKIYIEVNKNMKKFKMPRWWLKISLKFISPILLIFLFVFNMIVNGEDFLFYGANSGYSKVYNVIFGWIPFLIVFFAGVIIKFIEKRKHKVCDVPDWGEIESQHTEEITEKY